MDGTTPTGNAPVTLPAETAAAALLGQGAPLALSESAVADLLGITVKTLRNRRLVGDEPVAVRIGRTVVYLPEDVDAYLRSRRVATDTAAAPIAAGSPSPVKRGRGRPKGSITRRRQLGEG